MKQLTSKQSRHFIDKGYVVVREVFSSDLAARLLPFVWNELEQSPSDPSTWTEPIFVLRKVLNYEPFPKVLTKRYKEAVDDLCGAERWRTNQGPGYWPILFPGFATAPWQPPTYGWHLDANHGNGFYRLSSPERILVSLELFSDIRSGGGGTAIRVGSHHETVRVLANAQSEVISKDELYSRVLPLTRDFLVEEATGRAGDVIFIHPYTVHASSSNTSTRVRIAANRPFLRKEELNLKRSGAADFSLVERAIVEVLAPSI